MSMRSYSIPALMAVLAMLLTGALSAAPNHDHAALYGAGPPNIPPVSYIIRVSVQPESLLVRGSMDIEYRNTSFDTLHEVYFALPLNDTSLVRDTLGTPFCRLDSLLYRGAPLQGDDLASNGIILTARIPGGIAPMETGAFMLSFESGFSKDFLFDKGDGLDLSRWYPEICARVANVWYLPDRLYPDSSLREFADYSLELIVDSSWSLLFPGELINDKQHFGLLPAPDDTTVQEDLLENFSQIPGGKQYVPVFEDGAKSYYVTARNETGFPLLLHRALAYDRAVVDSIDIMVAYGKRQRKRWHGSMAADAAQLVRICTDSLGPLDRRHLTIAPVPLHSAAGPKTSLLMLPNNPRSRSLLHQMLAVRTAQLWLPRSVPDIDSTSWVLDEGLACFVAMSLGAADDSENVYLGLDNYRRWREKLVGWKNPATRTVVHTVPGWLRICSALTSDSIVWGGLREYSEEFRYVHPPADTLLGLLRARAAPIDLPTIDEAAWMLDSLDMVVSRAAFDRTDQGYSVSCELLQNGPFDLPIEIGFVDVHDDTLYSAAMLRAHPGEGEVTTVDFLSSRPLVAVVLDPHHRLPDFNRTNNYRFARPSRFRYQWPPDLFPAYERWADR